MTREPNQHNCHGILFRYNKATNETRRTFLRDPFVFAFLGGTSNLLPWHISYLSCQYIPFQIDLEIQYGIFLLFLIFNHCKEKFSKIISLIVTLKIFSFVFIDFYPVTKAARKEDEKHWDLIWHLYIFKVNILSYITPPSHQKENHKSLSVSRDCFSQFALFMYFQ